MVVKAALQTGRLGPWPGGVNLRDADLAPELLPATQLQFLLNLDATSSGVLRARLGCRYAGSAAMYAIITGGASGPAFSLLGTWDQQSSSMALVSVYTGTTANTSSFFYSLKPDSTSGSDWTAMPGGTLTGQFSTTVQYQGFLYLVPDAFSGVVGSGRRRADPTAGAWSAVAAIPRGDTATMIRERMFVVDQTANRVYYSKATDPTTWAAPDGGNFDVNPGDGQRIQAIAVVNSQMYIFKRSRTYLFTFAADPALDGQLTLISDQLGADDALTWENGVIVVNSSGVYRLLNNFFSRMDDLAPAGPFGNNFGGGLRPQVVLEGDNLVVRSRLSTGFTHLAMNLRTNAWSVRSYADPNNGMPASRYLLVSNPNGGSTAQMWNLYGHGSTALRTTALGPLELARTQSTLDTTAAGAIVSPRYSMLTSALDGGNPSAFKGLRGLTALVRNQLAAGDAVVNCRARYGQQTPGTDALDLDLSTNRQTVAVPSGQWGGKIPLVQYRFLSTAWMLDKVQTTLSPGITDPTTTHDLWIRGLEATIDARGGSERI